MPHQTAIKVRGFHLDLYGHVNNARYLEFLEEARWDWLESRCGLAWFMQQKLSLVVTRIDIRYKRAATMGDALLIHTRLVALNAKDGLIRQSVWRENKIVAEADVTFAVLHPELPGARPIKGELAERLSPALEGDTA